MHARPRVLVLTVALTLIVSAMLASVAMAAPGGKVKTTDATLSVSGDVAAASTLSSYGPLHVTGTGYAPDVAVKIVMTSPTAISFFGGFADAIGNVSIYNNTNSDGAYKMEAYQDLGKGQTKLMASITFTVNP